MSKIGFSIPLSPTQGFFDQTRLFNYSLRQLGGEYSNAKLYLIVGDNCNIEEVRKKNYWSNDFNVEWHAVPKEIFDKYGIHGTANWRYCIPMEEDLSFFCDADTIIVSPIDELIDEIQNKREPFIAGHQAHFPPPLKYVNMEKTANNNCWPEIFNFYGIEYPKKLFPYSMDSNNKFGHVPPYYNLGFIAMNKLARQIVCKNIFDFEDRFKVEFDSNMRCQIALTIIGFKNAIDFRNLGTEYNCANDVTHFGLSGIAFDDIKILHYLRENDFERSNFLQQPFLSNFMNCSFETNINEILRGKVRAFINESGNQ